MERHAELELLRLFHDRDQAAPPPEALDDRTWTDLDLDDVFSRLDFAVSEPGRQYLYELLRTPRSSADALHALERAVRRCSSDDAASARIRASLRLLGDRRSAYLVHLFYGDLPARPRVWWLFPLLTALSIGCLAFAALWPRLLLVWLAVCVVNIIAQLYYKPRVKRFIPAIHELPNFLKAAEQLGGIPQPELAEQAACLREGANSLRGVKSASRWLTFEPNQGNELLSSLYEYVNMAFLLDVSAFVFTVEGIRRSRDTLRAMFEAIGHIDAVQSIARWRSTFAEWTVPELTEPRSALAVEGLIHPLLDEPVPNALQMDHRGVLISGSNMAGKTTFVRALGVNAILAQTLHTVCAAKWTGPMLHVRTFIGRADSIADGKSYYLAEAEAVLTLIRAKEEGQQHLFLLDEIFRGTNTTERIAAASAVLAFLNAGADFVVVATHDLEVLDLLNGSYVAYHFTEQVNDDGLTFDYRIRPGPSSTRNAIALLKVMNYPDAVIADALANLDWQRRDVAKLPNVIADG